MDALILDFKQQIKHKPLVIFVGAGISKNSGVPTWGQVVQCFASRLDYRYTHLSTDDYIKIPQYYYSQDKSDHHQDYYSVLKDLFCQSFSPNILDELIVSLKPDHIITTNFDHLLDHYDYEVIQSDRDLLKSKSCHYLIKMHGDIDDIENIIFKEDDYLRYSQTHSLMELYIKSLLVDHTFLFVGYSLNDYNLKTFLSWIDYLAIEKNVKENMHYHYLMTCDIQSHQHYVYEYYRQKNIRVLDLNQITLTDENIDLEDIIGKKTYLCLSRLKNGD